MPDLNSHLEWVIPVKDETMLREVVNALLDLGTCFAVLGGELEVRTTERGAARVWEYELQHLSTTEVTSVKDSEQSGS